MKTEYDQIIDIQNIASFDSKQNITELIALAEQEQMAPAYADKKRVLLLAIDVQNDFMENVGSLPVAGSRGDVERLTRWMYRNLPKLTQVMCSLDTHSVNQIFHASWWTDDQGNHPQPFATISYADVLTGKWKATGGDKDRSLEYLKNLEQGGKKQLCIWAYHCLTGTRGAELESEFAKMLYFHSASRQTVPLLISKGEDPYSEMYGIIEAEYNPKNEVNKAVLDTIEQFDEIYVAGEASSHCVLASVQQIMEYFSDRPDITSRITLLEDCMSSIAGFEEVTQTDFQELRDKYGMQIKKSTGAIL